jgi:hypothetical protein
MLIGLTGAAGAGKDSVGAVLAAAGWQTVALADALRVEVAAAWGVDMRLLTDRTHKEHATPQLTVAAGANANWLRWATFQGHNLMTPRSPRWLLQQWGSFRRAGAQDYWIQHVAQCLYAVEHRAWCSSQPAYVVITDVRQHNEAAWLRARPGHLLRVHRPGTGLADATTAGHQTEVEHQQLHADGDIHNDGTLAHLASEVWRVVQGLQA